MVARIFKILSLSLLLLNFSVFSEETADSLSGHQMDSTTSQSKTSLDDFEFPQDQPKDDECREVQLLNVICEENEEEYLRKKGGGVCIPDCRPIEEKKSKNETEPSRLEQCELSYDMRRITCPWGVYRLDQQRIDSSSRNLKPFKDDNNGLGEQSDGAYSEGR